MCCSALHLQEFPKLYRKNNNLHNRQLNAAGFFMRPMVSYCRRAHSLFQE